MSLGLRGKKPGGGVGRVFFMRQPLISFVGGMYSIYGNDFSLKRPVVPGMRNYVTM